MCVFRVKCGLLLCRAFERNGVFPLYQLLTSTSQLSEQVAAANKDAADSRHKLDEVVGKMKTLLGKHRELQVGSHRFSPVGPLLEGWNDAVVDLPGPCKRLRHMSGGHSTSVPVDCRNPTSS